MTIFHEYMRNMNVMLIFRKNCSLSKNMCLRDFVCDNYIRIAIWKLHGVLMLICIRERTNTGVMGHRLAETSMRIGEIVCSEAIMTEYIVTNVVIESGF